MSYYYAIAVLLKDRNLYSFSFDNFKNTIQRV